MGKSKLFGSGSGKPVNSVKVTELAGEDIPANCFVTKVSGQNNQAVSASASIVAYLDKEQNIWLEYGHSNTIRSYVGASLVSTITLADYFKYTSLALLPTIKCFVLSAKTDTGTKEYNAHYLIRYDDSGKLTLLDYDYKYMSDYYGLEFVEGKYPSDWLYAIKDTTLYTFKIVNDKLSEQSYITASFEYDLTSLQQVTYLDGYGILNSNTISNSWRYVSLTNPETGKLVWQTLLDTSTYYHLPYGALYYSPLHDNSKIVDGFMYLLSSGAAGHFIMHTLNLSTGAAQYYDFNTTFQNTVWNFVLLENPYSSDSLAFKGVLAVDNQTIDWIDINFRTHSITIDTNISTYSYIDPELSNRGFAARVYKGAFYAIIPSDSTNGRTWLFSNGPSRVVIPTTDTIYGYTIAPIKAYGQGGVYCVDTSYPSAAYTTYGITEALATQIVDDSVDEIKQEVTM